MKSPRLSVSVRAACMAMLMLGLAVDASAAGRKQKQLARQYDQLMQSAEAEVGAGRLETALSNFNNAAMADPTRKEPWVRSAQLQFDAGNYGRAIVAAEEVLKRDPSDLVADSVLTVSGLRIASESLKRLEGRGAIASESARREAEQLRATMIATMGNAFVMGEPPQEPKSKARAKPRPKPKARVRTQTASAGTAPAPASAPAAVRAPARAPAATGGSSAPAAGASRSNPFD